jgi:cell wall-associated NlpC family hydrolase
VPFEFGKFNSKFWKIETAFNEDVIQPGDTILIGYSKEELNHFAVALGRGLYISKFGVDGPVLITTFATLQYTYGGFLVARAKPTHVGPSATNPK